MKRKLVPLLGLALIALTSCADRAVGPQFSGGGSLSGTKGRIVIYRPHGSYINQGGSPHVYINQTKRGLLKVDGYLAYDLDPGAYQVQVRNPWGWNMPLELNVSVPARQVVYLRLWTEANGLDGRYILSKVSAEKADSELGFMRASR